MDLYDEVVARRTAHLAAQAAERAEAQDRRINGARPEYRAAMTRVVDACRNKHELIRYHAVEGTATLWSGDVDVFRHMGSELLTTTYREIERMVVALYSNRFKVAVTDAQWEGGHAPAGQNLTVAIRWDY